MTQPLNRRDRNAYADRLLNAHDTIVAHEAGKSALFHVTRDHLPQAPRHFVRCDDGTEVPYPADREEEVVKAIKWALTGEGVQPEMPKLPRSAQPAVREVRQSHSRGLRVT